MKEERTHYYVSCGPSKIVSTLNREEFGYGSTKKGTEDVSSEGVTSGLFL